jgi:hypothetical protein
VRILGFDPGVRNFAWAVYDGQVREFGWISGHEIGQSDWLFLNSVVETLHRTKPDLVVYERFAFRDKASVESEPINVMIGKLDLLVRMKGIPVQRVMPAHWKVKLKTKEHAKGAIGLFPDVTFEAVHQADAAGIARYIFEKRVQAEADAVAAAQKPSKKTRKAKQEARTPASSDWERATTMNAKLEKTRSV